MVNKLYIFRDEGSTALSEIREKTSSSQEKFNPIYDSLWKVYITSLIALIKDTYSKENITVKVVIHNHQDLEKAKQNMVGIDPFITLDSYNTITKNSYQLGVSRVFKLGGADKIGIGFRPGYPQVEEQLKQIKEKSKKHSFILVDDDIFSGATIAQVVKLASDSGIKIKKIISGIQVSAKNLLGIPVESVFKYNPEEVLELNDPRDFLFGTYEAGLVIGLKNGEHVRVPYILPFVDVTKRASIPPTKSQQFSIKLLNLNRRIYSKLAKSLGMTIRLAYLSKSFQTFTYSYFKVSQDTSMDRVFDLFEHEIKKGLKEGA